LCQFAESVWVVQFGGVPSVFICHRKLSKKKARELEKVIRLSDVEKNVQGPQKILQMEKKYPENENSG
jgi:hypothetical protein